jgi:hypothetical protein
VPVAESPTVALRAAFKPDWETEMPMNERSDAVERFLDPAVREIVSAWIEQGVNGWRLKAMLGYPPAWRLTNLNVAKSS